ncbi:glycosyltransferase [Anabaena subtropica]|uniref:Glycosyltransferase n=1 Tax=Anabaena subtropica FACHB-260 TaxID=2692884 RepID=A0ABR8CUL6_9NOST|nr:glycosyltransferase [Anabaena subtropica]MBD2346053.1 glycosyltransferase [Anabaena subtropica FACHB-260]
MKVAFIVNQFPMLSETFILNQATGLIDLGHEVDIFTTYSPDPKNTEKMHSDVTKYHLLEHTFYAQTPPTNRIWRIVLGLWLLLTNFYKAPLTLMRSLNGFKYGWQATSLKLLYAVIPLLDKGSYDVIHCQFATLTFIGAVALPKVGTANAKLVVSCRGHDISAYMEEVSESIHRQIFADGDQFLPNCDFFRDRLLKLGCPPEKITVLRSGIDGDRFIFKPRHPIAGEPIRIVTTGRLTEKKGVEYGIRAIAKLIAAGASVEYYVVGDGPLHKNLQQLIDSLNVDKSVKLLGWMQQQELINILDRSHIFLSPNVTAADGNQDAPVNTIKEAAAMGLPVVSTFHGGIPEVVEDGISGFLVAERDADALAEKLQYLIDHPSIWQAMGEAGRKYVETHYDIHTLNNDLVKIYKSNE